MKKQLSLLTLGVLVGLGAVSASNAVYGDINKAAKRKAASKAAQARGKAEGMAKQTRGELTAAKTKILKERKAINKKIVSFLKRKNKQIENQHESYSNFIERNEDQLNQAQKNKLTMLQKKYSTIKDQLEKTIEKHEMLLEKMQ